MYFDNIIITDFFEALTVSYPKGLSTTISGRESHGFIFMINGQITFTHNGNSDVLSQNHVAILPKGKIYTVYGNKNSNYFTLNFESTNFFVDEITIIPIENMDFIIKEIEQIKKLHFFKNNRLLIMSSFYKILNMLTNNTTPKATTLIPAMKYIENNFCHDITNAEMAHKCNMSEEYFRKLFKKEYGVSPKQYITDMRINKAQQLLKEGSLKINAISEQCGFSNQYHFCRFFKQKTGFTPTEYMKQNRILNV